MHGRWLPPPLSWVVRPWPHRQPPARAGGPAARPRRPPSRASGPRPSGPRSPGVRRAAAKADESQKWGWPVCRQSRGGVRPESPRPNQALQRTAYHQAVARHRSRLPPPAELGRSAFAAPWAAERVRVFRRRGPGARGHAPAGTRPPRPAKSVGARGREGPRSAEVGLGRRRRSGGGVWPGTPRPNQALQRTAYHEAGSAARSVVSAAAELSRSAPAAPQAAGACGRSGGAAPPARGHAPPARGPDGREPCRRKRPRRRTKRSGGVGPGQARRAASVWPRTPRPNQALQRTAYHRLVLRPRRWFPPPLSWVVRPSTAPKAAEAFGRFGGAVPTLAVTRLRHAAPTAREVL